MEGSEGQLEGSEDQLEGSEGQLEGSEIQGMRASRWGMDKNLPILRGSPSFLRGMSILYGSLRMLRRSKWSAVTQYLVILS